MGRSPILSMQFYRFVIAAHGRGDDVDEGRLRESGGPSDI
jgi:hypothetical protein